MKNIYIFSEAATIRSNAMLLTKITYYLNYCRHCEYQTKNSSILKSIANMTFEHKAK